MQAQPLQDKVALVTGAASGIGRAVVLAYAAAGARVVASDVDEAGGRRTVELVGDPDAAVFVRADTSSPEDNQAQVDLARRHFGALHIACNNAGISGARAETADYPPDSWDKVLAVNLSGVFYGMRSQIPALLEAGGGAIVNITSILGQVGFRGACAYTSAKHGMVGLTRVAALEYGARGVRVNCVGPAFIRTPMIEHALGEEAISALAAQHPIGRIGEPVEVAELVVWLSSPAASFVTGSYYAVDGGYLAQ